MNVELPFLIVHGAVVWKVLLGVLVVASLTSIQLLRRWAARRSVRVAVDAELRALTAMQPGVVVLRGRLRGGSATTLSQGANSFDHASGRLWLAREGEQIEIDGPVRVTQGTGVRTSWVRPPRGLPAALLEGAGRCCATFVRSVKDGDDVIVTGALQQRGLLNAGYREPARWVLTPMPAGAIGLAAARPVARSRSLGPGWLGVLVFGLAIGWYNALVHVGASALERARRSPAAPMTGIDGTGDFAIAAAMPDSRDESLDTLARQLAHRSEHSEHVFQLRLAVASLRGECPVELFSSAGRFEEALSAMRLCGTPHGVAYYLLFLGRFEEARVLVSPQKRPYFALIAAIGAGRWMDAALAAEMLASKTEARASDEADRRIALAQRCIAALFRAYAGVAAPFDRIKDKGSSPRCSVLEALALPVTQQAEALGALSLGGDRQLRELVDGLRVAAGGLPPIDYGDDLVTPGRNALTRGYESWAREPIVWLAPFALTSQRQEVPSVIGDLHLASAARALLAGDVPAARRDVARAQGAFELLPRHYDELRLTLDLHDPSVKLPPLRSYAHLPPTFEHQAWLRSGKMIPTREFFALPQSCQTELVRAVETALAGDGNALAAVFRRCSVFWSGMPKLLLGILPRVTTHREELATALRLFRSEITTYSLENLPFRFLADVAIYRDLARFAGDDEEADAWQRIFDRHAEVLSDRQRLTAFLVMTH